MIAFLDRSGHKTDLVVDQTHRFPTLLYKEFQWLSYLTHPVNLSVNLLLTVLTLDQSFSSSCFPFLIHCLLLLKNHIVNHLSLINEFMT